MRILLLTVIWFQQVFLHLEGAPIIPTATDFLVENEPLIPQWFRNLLSFARAHQLDPSALPRLEVAPAPRRRVGLGWEPLTHALQAVATMEPTLAQDRDIESIRRQTLLLYMLQHLFYIRHGERSTFGRIGSENGRSLALRVVRSSGRLHILTLLPKALLSIGNWSLARQEANRNPGLRLEHVT